MADNDFVLEFRDGKRSVAPHVYDLLANIETYRLSYEEAMNKANQNLFSTHVESKHAKFVAQHFKEHR